MSTTFSITHAFNILKKTNKLIRQSDMHVHRRLFTREAWAYADLCFINNKDAMNERGTLRNAYITARSLTPIHFLQRVELSVIDTDKYPYRLTNERQSA